MMARRAIKRVSDSDDDIEMTESNSLKVQVDHQSNDYPTPRSEDSQNGPTCKLMTVSFEGAKKVSDEPRKLLTTINDIEALGIKKDKALDLPKIVAIGDQSAGKSSVIAAISSIMVPRKAGLCTRCPTHITLRTDTKWKCNVSLERKFILKRKNEWEPMDTPVITPFMEVIDNDHLEDVLFRAQAAILSPSTDAKDFASSSSNLADQPYQSEFSPNLIKLEISGPDCPELTFYDLPGVFNQTSKKEHQHLPQQIRKLVTEYINNENHILILACPMDGDVENSSAGSMINKNSGARKRCVGLLTKPDRLPEGNPVSQWRSILQGEAYHLEYGYFVTKQPSQLDLNSGIGYHQAREMEDTFFRETEPWKTEFAEFNLQFGTQKLQSKLSSVLVDRIRAKIPTLMETVDIELSQCNEQLCLIPEPPRDADWTVMRVLNSLQARLKPVMQGDLPDNGFILRWTKLSDDFKEAIHKVRPMLVAISAEESNAKKVAARRFEAKSGSNSKPITLDDEDNDEEDVNNDPSPSKKRSASSLTPSPSKRARLTPSVQQPNKYRLEEVMDVRIANNTSAIGSVDHRADEYIMKQTAKSWTAPLEIFVGESKRLLEAEVVSLIDDELEKWHGTALHRELLEYSREWISGAARRVQEFAERIVHSESIKPMTKYLDIQWEYVNEETKGLRAARRTLRAGLLFDEEQAETGTAISKSKREQRLVKDSLDAQLGRDPWEMELEIMGRVRGYYKLASGSFVDTVCKIMRLDMFERCREHLINGVETRFKLNDGSGQGKRECERLLAEDEERANQRLFLLREREKYEKAKKSLEEVFA